jgi:hypothetical protein
MAIEISPDSRRCQENGEAPRYPASVILRAVLSPKNLAHAYRLYVSRVGRGGQVAMELEFDTLAEQETWWAGWRP